MAQQWKKLLLCMTPKVSLAMWSDNGSIGRELFLYHRYIQEGWNVDILTCDHPEFLPNIPPGLKPIIGSWPLKNRLHLFDYLNPINLIIAVRAMAACDVVKTNQSVGAWFYAFAARIAQKPILIRCGWLPGRYFVNSGYSARYMSVLRFFERLSMKMADAIEVATEADRQFIVKKYQIPLEKIRLFPNWIDTRLFSPDESIEKISHTVVSVGRLEPVKRFDLLIDACSIAAVSVLTIIGEGPSQDELQRYAIKKNVKVKFTGALRQSDLPVILQQHEIFVLTSKVEGHPKALLEAMACGLPCIGTDVQGINEVIVHKKNGLLCESNADSIAAAIKHLFEEPSEAAGLGKHARTQVVGECDFETLFNRERALLESLCYDA